MKNHSAVFTLYAMIWVILLGGSKVWVSGFHFVDDHEVYHINDYINKHGLG
jgi:hypothetical protein